MVEYLPREVMFDIFLKLPVKTLILCSCVSTSWQSIITSPTFISFHLNHSKHNSKNRLFLVRRCYATGNFKKEERYSLHFDTEKLGLCQELKFPFANWSENFKIVGFCNGLLCLSGLNIILWNPSIQRFVSVPLPNDIFAPYGTPYKHALGFGFDSCSNDYKLIRLIYHEGETLYDYAVPPKVELYELSTGSWRGISSKAPPYEIVKSQWTQAFTNGIVHWIAFSQSSHRGFRCSILRFHVSEEQFSIMSLPERLMNESPENLKIAVLGGELCVLQCGWYPFGNRFVSSVWVLKNYDESDFWSKLVSVDPSHGLGMTLGLRENGDVLMTSRDGELVLCKPKDHHVRGLGIRGDEDSFYLDTYVESLVLINEGKAFYKEDTGVKDEEEELDKWR